MHDVAVIGAGKIGSTIAQLLMRSGDYAVTVFDRSETQLNALEGCEGCGRITLDIGDAGAVKAALTGRFAVLSAAPFHLTTRIAEAARAVRAHYFDLTEDVAATRVVTALADSAETAFIPQCGLAPGFITIAAQALVTGFDSVDEVRMRVGALPLYPSNALGYNLTWSTEGVINEYCEPCEAIVEGELRETLPLEECERFSLDGVAYEAFNTSGGLGTLCETLKGQVRTLNYRTIRYPGHAAVMKLLLNDLGLRRRREVLKDILETSLPSTQQDVVIVLVTVSGHKGGRLIQDTYARKIYAAPVGGVVRTAIQLTTAAGICVALDLLREGAVASRGLVRQEDIPLEAFLRNRFGRLYAEGGSALDALGSSRPALGRDPLARAAAPLEAVLA